MRVVLQRVSSASVDVGSERTGAIAEGLLLLAGIADGDDEAKIRWMADKISGLRVFRDAEGRMNRSVVDIEGDILVVSQFTLYGDTRKGKRPSFFQAARPEAAEPLFSRFVEVLSTQIGHVATGRFGAMMTVNMVGDGPVTLLLER